MRETLEALADLVFSSRCVLCSVPTRGPSEPVCSDCRTPWQVTPKLVFAEPRLYATRPYDRAAQQLILAVKEDGRRAAEPVLAEAMAIAALPLLLAATGPVLLVSVPSRAAARRSRGGDVLWSIVRQSAELLASVGWEVTARSLLRHRRVVDDQSALDARGRQANIAHSMVVRDEIGKFPFLPPMTHGIMGKKREGGDFAQVIVLDDLVTTGATMREAIRALGAGGYQVLGGASAASTALRSERRESW